MYKLVRPLLFRFDAESVHNATTVILTKSKHALPCASLGKFFAFEHPLLRVKMCGIEFKNPIGLAAGFDKNGYLVDVLAALGFGFIEVGTVTPRPQAGNPRPRLFRLPRDFALINRLGFNNEGAQAVAERLKRRVSRVPLGINIGKNKDTPNAKAAQDYAMCFRKLQNLADYIAVNVSSPNTPGLRELQAKKELRSILDELQQVNAEKKPIFLKIAPDLQDREIADILEVAMETKISGIIATNTTVSRQNLKTPQATLQEIGEGGLSGKPLAKRSTQVLQYLYRQSEGRIPLIGVGGVFSAKDAYEKIRAGASLVQLYTSFVYEGPGIAKRIKQGLVELLGRDGFSSLHEVSKKRI